MRSPIALLQIPEVHWNGQCCTSAASAVRRPYEHLSIARLRPEIYACTRVSSWTACAAPIISCRRPTRLACVEGGAVDGSIGHPGLYQRVFEGEAVEEVTAGSRDHGRTLHAGGQAARGRRPKLPTVQTDVRTCPAPAHATTGDPGGANATVESRAVAAKSLHTTAAQFF